MKKNILLLSAISAFIFFTSCDKKAEQNQSNNDSIPVDSIEITDLTIEEIPVPEEVVGTYEGTFPCADCEGIKTHLELNKDKTFKRTEEYLGKKKPEDKNVFETKGNYKVLNNKHVVLVPDSTEFVIGIDQLTLAPTNNNASPETNTSNYVLTKIKIKGDKEKIQQEVIDSTGQVIDKTKEKIKVQ